jgi:tight adherence protein B
VFLLAALCVAIAAPVPAIAAPSADKPDAAIGDIKSQQGTVQFLLSVGNLPDSAVLNPDSVVVSAGGSALRSTASDGGTKQTGQAPPLREAVLVIDSSGSMKSGDAISAARDAALAYANSLPKDVRVGLVSFNSKPTVLVQPTADRTALRDAVGQVKAGGKTALYDGILAASDLLKTLPADADRRVLVLSDGDDTASTHSLAEATAGLGSDNVAADVVAFRLPHSDQGALQTIADSSHGKVITAADTTELAGIFKGVASEFRQQVLVTVRVPQDLALKHVTMTATVNAGGETYTATTALTMPDAAPVPIGPRKVSAPAASSNTSNTELWIVLAVSFAAFFIVALAALLLPVMRAAEAERRSRLAEMNRYRVVSVVGATSGGSGAAAGRTNASAAITQRALSVVERTVRARGQRERIVAELDQAGMRVRPEEWAIIQFAIVLVPGLLLFLVTGSFIGLVIGAIVGWLAARAFVRTKISRRQNAFTDQLPDTLQLLASSLRTGFSLNQALGGVVREGTEPAASEFARALTEVRIGADLEDALDGVAIRMKSQDLTWVVMAIRISREVGGNLAEVLGTTGGTMRERAELRGQVRVLSAEGRISARILTALPFIVGAALALIRPGYLKPLFTQAAGIGLLCLGALLLVLGSFWLSRLVKIKV